MQPSVTMVIPRDQKGHHTAPNDSLYYFLNNDNLWPSRIAPQRPSGFYSSQQGFKEVYSQITIVLTIMLNPKEDD